MYQIKINKVAFFVLCIIITVQSSCNNEKTRTSGTDSLERNHSLNQQGENAIDSSKSKSQSAVNQDAKHPVLSKINTALDTALLFGIWTIDPNGPHADFVLSKNSYYVVDYDGDGDMPYELKGNDIKIYFKDFIQVGKILSVDRDSLKINWKNSDNAETYVRWKQ